MNLGLAFLCGTTIVDEDMLAAAAAWYSLLSVLRDC
jgi:hypothetical protein